jgi:hypothetical protein
LKVDNPSLRLKAPERGLFDLWYATNLMYWNHRVVKHNNGTLEIAEVYYEADEQTPGPFGWSAAEVIADADEEGGPVASLIRQVEWFKAAIEKPALPAVGCEKSCCMPPKPERRE